MKQQDPASFATELARVEKYFHLLINDGAKLFVGERSLEMPKLHEHFEEERYFPVDGMHGGFSYRFKPGSGPITLIVKS